MCVCVCARGAVWTSVLHTVPAMFTSSCQFAITPAQALQRAHFSVTFVSLCVENEIDLFIFFDNQELFPLIEMF